LNLRIRFLLLPWRQQKSLHRRSCLSSRTFKFSYRLLPRIQRHQHWSVQL
jgi:hypothetical protein